MSSPTFACAPAMLSMPERAHIRECASTAAKAFPNGRIIELGTFLGASSQCLCAGADDHISADRPLLVYDAFLTTPDMFYLYPMPVREGESFRALYDLFQHNLLSRMIIREGYMPEDAPLSEASKIYPEQEPISLLFVDLAKSEGVHRSIADIFFPHVAIGGQVIQQDFKHPFSTWLPLHMHALRNHFVPTHDIPGWTVTFRCTRPLTLDAVRSKALHTESLDPAAIESAWDATIQWLNDEGFSSLEAHMELHRAMHLLRAKQWQAVTRACQRAIDFACTSEIDSFSFLPNAQYLAQVLDSYAALSPLPEAEHASALLRKWSESQTTTTEDQIRAALWHQLALRCKADGYHRVALMGGGKHARWLLDTGWPGKCLELVAVLDDVPAELPGIQVCHTEDFHEQVDAIIICSTQVEETLFNRARAVFESRNIPVLPVYSPSLTSNGLLIQSASAPAYSRCTRSPCCS